MKWKSIGHWIKVVGVALVGGAVGGAMQAAQSGKLDGGSIGTAAAAGAASAVIGLFVTKPGDEALPPPPAPAR